MLAQRQKIMREYLTLTRDEMFEWGVTDCVRWASGFVRAMTGVDYMAGVSYDEKSAGDVLLKHGGLEAAATSALGPPIRPPFAWPAVRDGDIVLVEIPIVGQTFGIAAIGKGTAWCKRSPRGLIEIPLSRASLAWPVPCKAVLCPN